jgi:putative phosphoesterase
MKLIATSDLHFGSIHYSDGVQKLISEINSEMPDEVLILGDHCHGHRGLLEKLFELYSKINAPIMLCMGNHDYWVSKNQISHHANSLEQRNFFIKLCNDFGFHSLDEKVRMIENIAFVGGSMWYDYSFRPEGISEELCLRKKSEHSTWMDLEYVKLPYSDKEFCELELKRLEKQLSNVKGVKTIVSATHFLPFKECVTKINKFEWDYFNAFMGSEKIGKLLSKFKVQYAFYGHSHSSEIEIKRFRKVKGVQTYNVAYSPKMQFLIAEI